MKKLLTLTALAATLVLTGALTSGCCGTGSCPFRTASNDKKIAITDVEWKLEEESLAGSKKNWEEPDRDITFKIDKNGKLFGCSGVNRYFGTGTLDTAKKTLKFGPNIGVTRMAGKGMKYEDAYLKMLQKVDTYEIIGDKLYFKGAGKTLAVFED